MGAFLLGIYISVIAIGYCMAIILYFLTEPIFNLLHTLLIEPLIFIFEAINQLITDRTLEYAVFPTDEFTKLNIIVEALEPTNVITEVKRTKGLTLVVGSEEKISTYKKQQNSLFFKKYQDSDLLNQPKKSIVEANANLQLTAFNFFKKDILPKDIINKIAHHRLEIEPLL